MKEQANILVVDDDEDVLITAEVVLKQRFKTVDTTSDPNQIPDIITKKEYQIVLLDMNYSVGDSTGKEGLKWLDWLYRHQPQIQVVMITAYGEINLAVEAMKRGAVDFVTKPWQYAEIQETVMKAFQLSRTKEKVEEVRVLNGQKDKNSTVNLIGESPKLKTVLSMISKVAPTDANVLILGENGTGKELVARAIHDQSHRASNIFVTVDMGALTESLFESEIFGHVKGAFTDARSDREGKFEAANGGTLFLDEIGNLSPAMQSKLLSILQRRTVIRVGENKERPIDVRVLAATNMDLESMVKEGSFREDLLYRLNTIEIQLPPLRERIGDIELLSSYFLKKHRRKYDKKTVDLSDRALSALREYHWPGNIRELEHTLERAVIMASGNQIEADDLLLKPRKKSQFESDTTNLEEIEKRTIEEVIRRFDGNMSQVAKELGIGRTTLYRKIEKYGL
ncbi:sigma-54-dependent transcriptional regulator [Roseivirga sp.]|uniref:sigma-54-dependent transcriptional regulator n=1 Tax=Roseivirga sp. TaxID=1964215 RepID=UPI003B52C2B7